MIRTVNMGFVVGLLAAGIAAGPAMAQDRMKQDSMKQDEMKHDNMKNDGMMHEESAKRLFTGKFSGKVHKTEGRATVYQQADGKLLLRLTGFKTSNGPDVHVVLLPIKDPGENLNSLKSNTERIELGKLKGNEGDQNYEIPAGTDLSKFTTVSIYCERFNANFGAAPLEKF
jgi:pentapeptide MXKDX repeat protein